MNKKLILGIGITFIVGLFIIIKIIVLGTKQLEITYKTNGAIP